MVNEERVILMTKMASYEENEGKKYMKIGKYFRSDYVGIHMLKSTINVTIAYVIMVALYFLYHLDSLMEDLYQIDFIQYGKNLITYYLILVVVYGIISYSVYSYRYMKARKSLRCYYRNLKKLKSLY